MTHSVLARAPLGARSSARFTARRSGLLATKGAARSIAWCRYFGIVLLIAGQVGSWIQPAISEPLRARDLTVGLPGGRVQFVSWGLVLALAVLFALIRLTPAARRWSALDPLAALLAITSTVGFALQSCLADAALQEVLRQDALDLADLQLLVGYKIPRPTLSTLGPIPVPEPAAYVLSALRSGFYLALVGAVLLTVAAVLAHPTAVRVGRRTARWGGAIVVLLLGATIAPSMNAKLDLNSAAAAAAAGDDQAAVQHYKAAFGLAADLQTSPDLLAEYGLAQLRTGPADDEPAGNLASSRLLLQAGKDLDALQIVAAATARWPQDAASHEEFTNQAFAYLRRHGSTSPVRTLLSSDNQSALLRIALAKYELSSGDLPSAIADAKFAESLTADDDVRSIALTLMSVAQSRSGDLTTARQTLLAAVDADKYYVNVMARSMLAGLYTTLPL